MRCTCRQGNAGQTTFANRNWDPDCIHHGTESKWWNSPEEVARREQREQAAAMKRRSTDG